MNNTKICFIYLYLLIFVYNFEITNVDNISFLYNLTKSLVNNFTDRYIENKNITDNITNSIGQINNIYKIIKDSGKRLNDLGSFSNCLSNKTLETLEFNFSVILIIKNKDTIQNSPNPAIKFLNMQRFLYGLCLPQQWINLFYSNNSLLENVKQKIKNESNLKNIAIWHAGAYSANKTVEGDGLFIFFLILVIFLIVFLILKIIAWILIVSIFTHKNKYRIAKIYEEEENEEEKDETKEIVKIMKNNDESKFKENLFTKTAPIESIDKNKNSKFSENSKIKYILNSLDIFQSLKYLTTKKNKYYDSTNLELFFFCRAITIFFMVYAHNFYNMTKNPVPNFADEDFYKSSSMIVLKFSTFCTVLYIGLEGFEASFKLFSYIKKDMLINQLNYINIRISKIFKFLLYMIPSIIVVIFCFFTMGIELENYSYLLNSFKIVNPMLNYFTDDVYLSQCTMKENKTLIFKSFRMLYFNYFGKNETNVTSNNRGFKNCYKYVNIFYNIFFCYIILLISVYTAMKIKKRCFEIMFIILIIFSGGISYILMRFSYYPDYKDFEKFSLDFLLGENYSYKYTHLFLCYYFYGVFAGIIYFYFIDALSRKPLSSYNEYLPFEICFNIAAKLDSLSFRCQLIISAICISIITILSSWFWIKINWFDSPLLFDITNEIYIYLDLYEKQIFLICALIFILILLFHTGSYKGFKTFYSNSVFIFIGRSSHFMLCTMDFIISMFYCLYNIVIYFDFMSTLIYTIGQFSLCLFLNVILNILVEQPFKIIIKKSIGNKDNDSESINDDEMEVYVLK